MIVTKRVTYVSQDGFEFRLEPVEDTISIEKTKDGYVAKYLVRSDGMCDDSPDSWQDEGLFLVNYHRNFQVERDNIITEDDVKNWYAGEKIEQSKEYHIFMLSCLVHSGVWLSLNYSFNCDAGGWDTSHVGVVLVAKKEMKTRKKAFRLAQTLINDWNTYLSGDVYDIVKEYYSKNKEAIDYDCVCAFYTIEHALAELKQF